MDIGGGLDVPDTGDMEPGDNGVQTCGSVAHTIRDANKAKSLVQQNIDNLNAQYKALLENEKSACHAAISAKMDAQRKCNIIIEAARKNSNSKCSAKARSEGGCDLSDGSAANGAALQKCEALNEPVQAAEKKCSDSKDPLQPYYSQMSAYDDKMSNLNEKINKALSQSQRMKCR